MHLLAPCLLKRGVVSFVRYLDYTGIPVLVGYSFGLVFSVASQLSPLASTLLIGLEVQLIDQALDPYENHGIFNW